MKHFIGCFVDRFENMLRLAKPEVRSSVSFARKWLRRRIGMTLAVSVVLAAFVGLIANPIVPHNPTRFMTQIATHLPAFGWNVLYCALIGLLEELLFCGAVLPLIYHSSFLRRVIKVRQKASPKTHRISVALVCAIVFGLLHIGTGMEMHCGWLGVSLKVVQASLFGFCMVTLRLISGSLVLPIATHALFDLIYLGIPNVMEGISPLGSQSTVPELFGPALFTMLFLLIPASYAFSIIKRKDMIDPSLLPRQVWLEWLEIRKP